MTVAACSQLLDIPMANASRLMKAMRACGLLETIGDSKRHRPGRLLLNLSSAFHRSSFLLTSASTAVRSITERFGHTSFVTILDGDEVVGVAHFTGTNALLVSDKIGRRLPAFATAAGRSLLARLPDDEIRDIIGSDLVPLTRFCPTTPDEVLESIAEFRRCGYAVSRQETTLGVDAFAIAVGDPSTGESVSLCVVFPAITVTEEENDAILESLAMQASVIAAQTRDRDFRMPRLARRGAVA